MHLSHENEREINMRRKKDDKRVLRRGNGSDNKRNRRTPHMGIKNRNKGPNKNRNRVKKQKKRSGKTVLLMIFVLIAFIVGAGAGILLSFDDGSDDVNETHVENVTVEMTTNLNDTDNIVFEDADHVDFNENQTSEILDVDQNPYYNDDGLNY